MFSTHIRLTKFGPGFWSRVPGVGPGFYSFPFYGNLILTNHAVPLSEILFLRTEMKQNETEIDDRNLIFSHLYYKDIERFWNYSLCKVF